MPGGLIQLYAKEVHGFDGKYSPCTLGSKEELPRTLASNNRESMMYSFIDTTDGFPLASHTIDAFEQTIITNPETYVKNNRGFANDCMCLVPLCWHNYRASSRKSGS